MINSNIKELVKSVKEQDEQIKTKEPKIVRVDIPENDNQKVFTALGSLNLKNWLVTNYTSLMNNIREALEIKINGKENSFVKNSAFNKSFGTLSDDVLEGTKLAEILGVEYGGIVNSSASKVIGKAYYCTANKAIYKCTQNNSLNYIDANYYEDLSNDKLLGKLQNLFIKGSNSAGFWTKNLVIQELIQRGDSGTYSNRQIKTITLPTSFSDTNYIVIVVNMNTTADNFYAYQPHAKTLSNFKIRCQDSAGSSGGTVCWIAIGY